MMTKWQRIEKQRKDTTRFLKKCEVAVRQSKFGFKPPVVNGVECTLNEYFIEEVRA